MRLSSSLHLCLARLRARWAQECFALLGITAGVALLFAAQVAGTSLQSSVSQLSQGISGKATLQLRARGPQGMPQSMLTRVRKIAGVRVAAPLLEVDAQASGPKGGVSIELIGADASLGRLGGALVAHAALSPFGGIGAVVLPASLARTIGVTRFGEEVELQVAGRISHAPLYMQLHEKQIGQLAQSPVAIAPLFYAQEVAGLHARISRILVQPTSGREAQVKAALRSLAAGRLNVQGAGYDAKLFSNAAAAASQSTELFATIGALVGFLFAFNAILITVPQRRKLVIDLRRDGYGPGTTVWVLLLDAAILGLPACIMGLALGQQLSIRLLRPSSTFLSLAFTFGQQRVVSWQSVAVTVAGGLLASATGVLIPLREATSRDPLAAARVHEPSRAAFGKGWLTLGSLACVMTATSVLLVAPQAAMIGMAALLVALLLMLPLVFDATLGAARWLAATASGIVAHVAIAELAATRVRSLAVAAIAAVAVFGSVAIEGAHGDLLAGLERVAEETNASAEIWVSPAGADDVLKTAAFAPGMQATLSTLRGVIAVGLYRGGLLDYGDRRVMVLAPPSDARPLLPSAEMQSANTALASARVRNGGWLVISQALAREHGLKVGDALTLPSPDPRRFRVAALSDNLGWAPGAITMNATDYAQAWGGDQISAYGVLLRRGFPIARAISEIEHTLGPRSGLFAQAASQHVRQQKTLDGEALARLTQIGALIPVAAALTVLAVMGAMVWQRRPRLAKMKLDGLSKIELWSIVLLESGLLLGAGCLIGAAFGLYGQRLADYALADVVNFPIVYAISAAALLRSIALVFIAAAAMSVPGYLAARVPAALALQD